VIYFIFRKSSTSNIDVKKYRREKMPTKSGKISTKDNIGTQHAKAMPVPI